MQLNFKSFGQGPPLVILHGLFGTLDNWQTLGKQWAEDYTVYLIDQRNHGRSPHLDTISYKEMAEDLAGFLESEWIHKCHLLGHSMGGKVAMQFALDYPDLVEKLIIVDIAPKKYPAGHNEIFDAMLFLDLNVLKSRSAAAEQLSNRIKDPGVVQFLLKNLSRVPGGGFAWKMNLAVLHRDYQNILQTVGGGDPFAGETLFIRGAKSRYVEETDLPAINRLFPTAELITVQNAGHWIHAEQPAELFSVVSTFLKD